MKSREYPRCGQRVYRTRLGNGMTLLVLPKPGSSVKFAGLAVKYGGTDQVFTHKDTRYETPAGIAHFLEHAVFETPEGSALERMSALGASVNAYTGPFETMYHVYCTEQLETLLEMLFGFVMTPVFPNAVVQREREVITQELNMLKDRPANAALYGLMETLFSRHPIREHVGGTAESMGEITPELLSLCHSAFYQPRNMVLCVVGDVNPDKIAEIAARCTPDGSGYRPETAPPPAEALEPQEPRRCIEMPVARPRFRLGGRIRLTEENPLQQTLTAELAMNVLLAKSAPLYTEAYEKGIIDRSFGWGVSFRGSVPYWLCGGESDEPGALCARFGQQAADMAAWGVEKNVFLRQKRTMYGQLLRQLDDPETLCMEQCIGVFEDWDPLAAFECLEGIQPDAVQAWIGENCQARRLGISVVKNSEKGR